jgi:hypothetical protein
MHTAKQTVGRGSKHEIEKKKFWVGLGTKSVRASIRANLGRPREFQQNFKCLRNEFSGIRTDGKKE